MRVEDELRTAFGEIVGGPVPVRVEPGDVVRAVRTLRNRRAAGAGAALLAVGLLATVAALPRTPRDPIAAAPLDPPVDVLVTHESGRVSRLVTPDGPEQVIQETGPALKLAGAAPFGIVGLRDGWLVRVSATGLAPAARAQAWARGIETGDARVWAVNREGGRLIARPVTATAVGRPVTLPPRASELAGEVPEGLVVEVERAPLPGDVRDDVTPVPTAVTDVVLTDAVTGATKRVLASNAHVEDVRAGFVVVSRDDPCANRGDCPSTYRLDVGTGDRRYLPDAPDRKARTFHRLSPEGGYAATLATTDRGDIDTEKSAYRLWLVDVDRGTGKWLSDAASSGTMGSHEWNRDGALVYGFRRDGKAYVAWYRPDMSEHQVGSQPLPPRSEVVGSLS